MPEPVRSRSHFAIFSTGPLRYVLHAAHATHAAVEKAMHLKSRKPSVNHRTQHLQQSQRMIDQPMPRVAPVLPAEAESVTKLSGMSLFPDWDIQTETPESDEPDEAFFRELEIEARRTEAWLGPELRRQFGDRIPAPADVGDRATAERVANALGGMLRRSADRK